MWEMIKADFTGKLFKNLELLSNFIKEQVAKLTKEVIISACSYSYIFKELYWTI
jgi:hypothetical protein